MNKVEVGRKKKINYETSQTEGNEYPLDIWFLISEYIQPEDVGRFAGICKTAFAVVCRAKFWFSLYRRYYRSIPTLPERLQPECMLRLYGVRASVIRALFYTYTPFSNRIATITTFEQHPDTLVRRQCITMWHRKQNKQWFYYFKLKNNLDFLLSHNGQLNRRKQPDLIEMLEDVSANSEENCRVLVVTSTNFIPVPAVLGYTLLSATLNLSQGLRHHRLQLFFGSGVNCKSSLIDRSGNQIVLIDPVTNVRVLDWWHPLYPYSDNLQLLLNRDEYLINY